MARVRLTPLLLALAVMIAGCDGGTSGGSPDGSQQLADDVKRGGPLEPTPGRSEATAPVDFNDAYSWGLIYLDNKSDDPAQVEALNLGQIPNGLRVLGSYAVPGNAGIGILPGYTPNRGRPVVGLTIPPRAEYNVVVGLSATARGRHMIPEVRVRYTSGDQKYEARFRQSVVLCAPKVDYTEGCPSSF
jgi:hypothetical protein